MKNINKYTILFSLNNKNLEKDIIVLEKMNKSDNPNDKPSKPKQSSLREIVIEGFKLVNERIDRIEERIDKIEIRIDRIETRMDKIEAKLETVIKLNNLKS
ncbi:MAG: hypothetical protein LBD05_00670 [Mycoplasmataceae bacterium]|jgi:tetrahydromethanopterin S-methyltransferase subunit G|nr:hypothetical protein [Mycoplasmataceae bacterium]